MASCHSEYAGVGPAWYLTRRASPIDDIEFSKALLGRRLISHSMAADYARVHAHDGRALAIGPQHPIAGGSGRSHVLTVVRERAWDHAQLGVVESTDQRFVLASSRPAASGSSRYAPARRTASGALSRSSRLSGLLDSRSHAPGNTIQTRVSGRGPARSGSASNTRADLDGIDAAVVGHGRRAVEEDPDRWAAAASLAFLLMTLGPMLAAIPLLERAPQAARLPCAVRTRAALLLPATCCMSR
ncbi:MAG: hypothetical protein ACI8Y8_000638 [Planctomycetota bacterium]|jgi:hypothetical protein